MKIIFTIFITLLVVEIELFAAEAGMPQLDPKYWASQSFWLVLVFSSLYLIIAKLFIPKIKNNLDTRNSKIKKDLDEAKNLKDIAEKKQLEYEKIIENAKKEVQKILFESKDQLSLNIQSKKSNYDKDIAKEVEKTKKEILIFKKNSIEDINKISKELTAKIIEEISGDKLNESSITAAVLETYKKKINYYL